MSSNIKNLFKKHYRGGFTMVEVAAAVIILGLMLSSILVLMSRYVNSVLDMQLRQEAFELARTNMEMILSEDKISDVSDYGTDERNPDLEWSTLVEPFYEPVTNQMWIRAVCTTAYMDSKAERQKIELEHWITNLTAAQIKQILAQQKIDQAYLDLIQSGEYTDVQQATIAFLEQEGLDVEAYKEFLEKQRREKLEYLDMNGFKNYEEFLKELEEEENEFLDKLGMDFDKYNEFAPTFIPQNKSGEPDAVDPDIDTDPDKDKDKDKTKTKEEPDPDPDCIDCSSIPKEFMPLIDALKIECCPGTRPG